MNRKEKLFQRHVGGKNAVTTYAHEEYGKNHCLERALHAAEQANIAKGELVSRISHEIRTPVNIIVGLLGIVKQEESLSPGMRAQLDKVDIATTFLLDLINDVLEMAKLENGKSTMTKSVIHTEEFLSHIQMMAEMQALEKGITIRLKREGLATCYEGDGLKLQQVLMNLLSNALKFTPRGGLVQLVVRAKEKGEKRDILSFSVRDTGIGIRSALLPVIFDPFIQDGQESGSTYGGTGLGLAISKRLVTLMGGTIEVESKWGHGSVFVVTIPLEIAAQSMARSVQEKQPILSHFDCSEKRVLVVDDQPINVELTRMLLELQGMTVEEATNGADAVDRFVQAPTGYYDAVLMDAQMPVMDGWTAATNIRNSGKPDGKIVPIIAMTASVFDEDIKKTGIHGMNAHLAKPIEAEQLYRILDRCFFEEANQQWKRSESEMKKEI